VGELSIYHWLIVLAVVIIVFGWKEDTGVDARNWWRCLVLSRRLERPGSRAEREERMKCST
jgi:hypothetical protein